MPVERFGCFVADVPWKFGDSLPGGTRGASKQYRTMTVEEACEFPLPPLADDCYLFFWRVSSMVEEAYQVVRAWGFTAKTELVWQKLTKNGKPWFGMGRTLRASHETAIVATRGRPKPLSRSVRSTFSAPVPVGADGKYIHSAKPDEFFAIAERLTKPGVELFARKKREGWLCLGDQA